MPRHSCIYRGDAWGLRGTGAISIGDRLWGRSTLLRIMWMDLAGVLRLHCDAYIGLGVPNQRLDR